MGPCRSGEVHDFLRFFLSEHTFFPTFFLSNSKRTCSKLMFIDSIFSFFINLIRI